MDLAFPWPQSNGEWLAFAVAVITTLIGLVSLFAPRLRMRALGLTPVDDRPLGLAAMRGSFAGFPLGVGVSCIVLQQDWLYLALGLCWAFAAFGRLISILSDRGGSLANAAMLLIEAALAVLALGYGVGLIA